MSLKPRSKSRMAVAQDKYYKIATILVYKKHGKKCFYCGAKPEGLDHIVNRSLSNYLYSCPQNLVPCCGRCNLDMKINPKKKLSIIESKGIDYNSLLELDKQGLPFVKSHSWDEWFNLNCEKYRKENRI
jgi:5-methylcytosine-specific restriction endonuclease McrA